VPQPLKVDTTELRLSAASLDAVNSSTSAQLTQNARALASCQNGWVGTPYAAFEHVRDTWDLADTARGERLADIAMNLYRSADLYDHRDQTSGEDIEQTM
jgi:uncharacterized protein YukE